jgi:protein-S-isoprenylcysteine O-methyltransferase Ste14
MRWDIPAEASASPAEKRRLILRGIAQAAALLVFFSPFVFLPAGCVDWPMAWALLITYIGGLTATNLWLALRHTGLAKERADTPATAKRSDRLLVQLANFLIILVALPLAGLDKRFGWTPPLPLIIPLAAVLLFAACYVLFFWAMASNEFFSSLVRIQSDRGHSVASGGPYRFVRHPGYVAMTAQFLLVPVALGSLWALLPAAAAAGVYILRTALEDRMLQKELPGYAEYARRVRYRLIPGIW